MLLAEVGGAKSGGVAKQKGVGNVGKLTQVSPLRGAPLPSHGRRQWCSYIVDKLLLTMIHSGPRAEHGQSHSEADRKGHSFPSTTLAFQDSHRLSSKGKVSWQSIKRNL